MVNKTKIETRLKGWHPIYRGRLLLLGQHFLSKEEYLLYEASLSLADWDKSHKNTYGTLDLTQEDIEYVLGVGKGFVSRNGNSLIRKGLWKKGNNGKILVVGFELIDKEVLTKITKEEGIVRLGRFIARIQPSSKNLQPPIVNLQQPVAKEDYLLQPEKVASLQQPSSIFKFSSKKNNLTREKADYEQIIKEEGYQLTTPDDLEWIDKNVGLKADNFGVGWQEGGEDNYGRSTK